MQHLNTGYIMKYGTNSRVKSLSGYTISRYIPGKFRKYAALIAGPTTWFEIMFFSGSYRSRGSCCRKFPVYLQTTLVQNFDSKL